MAKTKPKYLEIAQAIMDFYGRCINNQSRGVRSISMNYRILDKIGFGYFWVEFTPFRKKVPGRIHFIGRQTGQETTITEFMDLAQAIRLLSMAGIPSAVKVFIKSVQG